MKLAFIIPYRDRAAHLGEFMPHYRRRFKAASFYVIEQENGKPFNRAMLLNIRFLEFYDKFDYFAAHDVDMLCDRGDYSYCPNPTQLATKVQQFKYRMPFPEYFGGVTLFNNHDFIECNGYSNNFWGYGGEDNEMYFNVLSKGLKITYRDGWYHSLYHPPSFPGGVDWEKMKLAKEPRSKNDGLGKCKYAILKTEDVNGYTKLTVRL